MDEPLQPTKKACWDKAVEALAAARHAAGPSPAWLAQPTWYIDAVNGSDANDGATAATALKTHAELERRISDTSLTQDTTVNILTDLAEPIVMTRNWRGAPTAAAPNIMTYLGAVQANLVIGTVATYVAPKHTVPANATQITSAAVADWTPYVNKRIRMTSGAAVGAVAWILRANPQGTGVATARTTPFALCSNGLLPTLKTPAPGDSFVVEELPTVTGLQAAYQGPTWSFPTHVNMIFDGLAIVSNGQWGATITGGFIHFRNSFMNAQGPADPSDLVMAASLWKPYSGSSTGRGRLIAYACGFTAGILNAYSTWLVNRNHICDNCAMIAYYGADLEFALDGAQFFDNAQATFQDGVLVTPGCTVTANSVVLSGNGNAGFGVRVKGGSFIYEEATSVPTVTGALGDASFADIAQTGLKIPWSSAPIALGQARIATADEPTPDALEGTVTFGAADTAKAVALPAGVDTGYTTYEVEFVEQAPTGAPAPSVGPWATAKAVNGFTANISAAPGAGTDRTFTWRLKNL